MLVSVKPRQRVSFSFYLFMCTCPFLFSHENSIKEGLRVGLRVACGWRGIRVFRWRVFVFTYPGDIEDGVV